MNYVVDASVAVKWYVPEIFEAESALLLRAKYALHVPDLIIPEFCSIVWKKVRRGELTKGEGDKIVSAIALKNWTIHPHRRTLKSAFSGAIATGQTVYDWTYLALAISLSCEMVTADERFYNAIRDTAFGPNLKWIGDLGP